MAEMCACGHLLGVHALKDGVRQPCTYDGCSCDDFDWVSSRNTTPVATTPVDMGQAKVALPPDLAKAIGSYSSPAPAFAGPTLVFLEEGPKLVSKEEGSKSVSKVNHPAYYGGKDNPYEAIKVIEAWGLDFCLGNSVKYISRAGKKDADKEIEDLEKAAWYLARRIEQLKAKSQNKG